MYVARRGVRSKEIPLEIKCFPLEIRKGNEKIPLPNDQVVARIHYGGSVLPSHFHLAGEHNLNPMSEEVLENAIKMSFAEEWFELIEEWATERGTNHYGDHCHWMIKKYQERLRDLKR